MVGFLLKKEGVKEQMQLEAKSEGRFTPLYQACRRGHADTVKLLLDEGANHEATDPTDNSTPLYIAASEGHVNIIELLRTKGANAMVEVVIRDGGQTKDTPFLVACRNNHMDVVHYLTQNGFTGGAVHPYDAEFLQDLYMYTDGNC
jgi:ankyrin repeat protein